MTDFTLTDGADIFPQPGDATSGNDRIRGLAGADRIRGGGGDDEIFGGSGVDTLFGEDGDDVLDAGLLPTEDVLDGGVGNDVIVIDYQNVINTATNLSVRVVAVFSTSTWATLIDDVTGVTAIGFENMSVSSGNADDSLAGGAGDDVLTSLAGNDSLYGGAGNDRIAKSTGVYDLRGGDGFDALTVGQFGSAAGLMVDARSAIGTISAGAGTSGTFRGFEVYAVTGTSRDDRVFSGAARDTLSGLDGADLLDGGGGADLLDGGTGRDLLYGGAGNDTLTAGAARTATATFGDQIFGGAGDDILRVATGFSGSATGFFPGMRMDGGGGDDRLELSGGSQPMDLRGAALAGVEALSYASSGFLGDVILTAAQFNMFDDFTLSAALDVRTAGDLIANGDLFLTQIRLFSGGQKIDLSASTRPGADFGPRVTGSDAADTIIGSVRRDGFFAAGGNDRLNGAGGSDDLAGGRGTDRMTGGAGADTFTFVETADSAPVPAARDTITDFSVTAGAGPAFTDRIALSLIDARPATTTNDAFAFIGGAAFSAAGQVRVVQQGADTVVQVNTAGTGTAEMAILLTGVAAASLSAADFIL